MAQTHPKPNLSKRAAKRERLEARLTPEQKALVQHAADLSGRSLSDFVVNTLTDKAGEIIRAKQIITLTAYDSQLFAETVLQPSPPGERLRTAVRRHRELVAD